MTEWVNERVKQEDTGSNNYKYTGRIQCGIWEWENWEITKGMESQLGNQNKYFSV